jgi:hypothetical protein
LTVCTDRVWVRTGPHIRTQRLIVNAAAQQFVQNVLHVRRTSKSLRIALLTTVINVAVR